MTLFVQVADASRRLAATRSKLAKVDVVAQLLAAAEPAELSVVARYLAGELPQRRTGVGYRGLGNLPEPAPEPTLTVLDVHHLFDRMAELAGHGSVAERRELVRELFSRATESEQQLLRGLITGDVRQGAGDGILLAAIAKASEVPEADVRRAVMLAGDPAEVVVAAREGGTNALARIGLVIGRPMRPMLAASAATVAEAGFTGNEPRLVDTKLDGIRIQAHKASDNVRLFTRSLDEITDRLPEVVEAVRALPAASAVLDGEAIALDSQGRPQPFQVTGARTASSADPGELRHTTPVTPFFFDLVHLDGDDLLDRPLHERRRALERLAPDLVVPAITTADPEQAQQFFTDVVRAGHEGVVVKAANAPYSAGRRGAGWVKVKPRHTVDLVVLAVERGSGRRTCWLSNIHLGARDAQTGELKMVGKTFKGMTDEMLRWQTERFGELAEADDGWTVTVRPQQVVEIAYDGLQRSRRYPAGMALRFARVVRYRDDKSADEADTTRTLADLAGWD